MARVRQRQGPAVPGWSAGMRINILGRWLPLFVLTVTPARGVPVPALTLRALVKMANVHRTF